MLTEKDFCDYDTCVALKELGFREKCVAYYDADDNVGLLYNTVWYEPSQVFDMSMSHNTENYEGENFIDAPTLYEAQKWLREAHNLHIEITYSPSFWTGKIYDLREWDYIKGFTFFESFEETLHILIKKAVKILKDERID
jgi:hypothetical protein